MIYFIRAGEDGPIKIGSAGNPVVRLIGLQPGNHLTLTLIRTLPGGRTEECALQKRFSHLHIFGEWYHFDPLMLTVSPEPAQPGLSARTLTRQKKGLPPNGQNGGRPWFA